ncbi:methyltransferase domain-containing protein [Pseudonocardia zijingensis]
MSSTGVDEHALRAQVRAKYRDVARFPTREFHFHTGRALAERLGYDEALLATLPAGAVESFAGVGNPFSLHPLRAGERVVDVGSGAGLDTLVAASHVGPSGAVIGVDMTPEMLEKARAAAAEVGLRNVEFREALAEALPVEDGWADVVISNGALNLCPDKSTVFAEIRRVLRPGGRVQFADIVTGRPIPQAAVQNIDLWAA